VAVFRLRRAGGGSSLRGGDGLRVGSPAADSPPQTIDLGTIASAEDVPGPDFVLHLALGTIDPPEAPPGPNVYEPLTVALPPIATEPNVPGPVIIRPADPDPELRTVVKVYDRTNTNLIGELDERAAGASFQDVIGDTGSGTAVVMNDDPDLAFVDYTRVLRFEVDGLAEFASIIEGKRKVVVAREEEAGQATAALGRGLLAALENAIVYPVAPGALVSDHRVFGFASPDLETGSFEQVRAISILSGPAGGISTNAPPEGWPDMSAKKIWVEYPPATAFAPPMTVYVRHAFNLEDGGTFRVSWTGDDAHELWLDGVLLGRNEEAFGFLKTSTVTIRLGAGTHYLAMKGENGVATDDGSGNVAWLLCSVQEINADGTLGTVVARSNEMWSGRVGAPPGFTVGRILEILVAEAQARGSLTGLELAFDGTVDSFGNGWEYAPDLAFDIGRSLLAVMRQLIDEGWIDRVRMTPVGFRLEAYRHAGQVRPTTLYPPTDPDDPYSGNLTELTREGSI
jgi:hypothetical protein